MLISTQPCVTSCARALIHLTPSPQNHAVPTCTRVMKMCFTPNIALFLRHDPPPIPPATSRATNSSDPPRSSLLQPTTPSHRSKNIGTVFSRSLAAPSPRPSQITSDSLHHERDRMTRQLRHRKTMARGREERHIRSSWPNRYRSHGRCRHANSYRIIVMKAFQLLALRYYRTACCLSAARHAPRARRTPRSRSCR